MKSYFNTINLSGEELKRHNARAISLENLLTAIFKANPDKKITPSQLHKLIGEKYDLHNPITSVRRGLTNLTQKEPVKVLIKLPEKTPSPYNSLEHYWKYNTDETNNKEKYTKGEKTAGDYASGILTPGKLFD